MTTPRPFASLALMACTIGLAPSAAAQSLQEILDVATAARDRAIQARDRATEARNVANSIESTIQTGVQTLTGQMRTFISDALAEATRVVNEELAGRDTFVNGPAGPAFRQQLVGLLQNLETIFNGLLSTTGPATPSVSFADEIQLLQSLPLQVLYPLYRALQPLDPLLQGLPVVLANAANAMQQVQQLLVTRYSGIPGASIIDYELGQSSTQVILANPTAFRDAVQALQGAGGLVKLVGKILEAKGHTGLAAMKLQIHGYAGVALASDQKMKWGTKLTGIAEMMMKTADSVSEKIDRAILFGSLGELRDNQRRIIEGQTKILLLLRDSVR